MADGDTRDSLNLKADTALRARRYGEARLILERLCAEYSATTEDRLKLAAVCRLSGDLPAALEAVHAVLEAEPFHVVALLFKAKLHESLNEPARAAELYRAAQFHAEGVETPEPAVHAQLQHAAAFLRTYRAQLDSVIGTAGEVDAEHLARAVRLRDNVVDRRAVFRQEPSHYRYPGLADVEFFDFAYPQLLARLRQAFPAICEDYAALAAAHADRRQPYVDFAPGQPVGQWSELNRSAAWNALHLVRYGEPDPVNAAMCSRTLAALAGDQPDIAKLAPNVMFSLLAPRTHIPPHHGVANFRAVLHLPLIVPPGCHLRVGAETREWIAGEPWIFDDTIEHEAWNDSDELRVVLIADLWRPELDMHDRQIVRDFMAACDLPRPSGAL